MGFHGWNQVLQVPTMLWQCWHGNNNNIRPVKTCNPYSKVLCQNKWMMETERDRLIPVHFENGQQERVGKKELVRRFYPINQLLHAELCPDLFSELIPTQHHRYARLTMTIRTFAITAMRSKELSQKHTTTTTRPEESDWTFRSDSFDGWRPRLAAETQLDKSLVVIKFPENDVTVFWQRTV